MEELTLLCYDKCGTCRKAGQWLRAHGLDYTVRPIREQNPSEAELDEWITASGLPVARFFNTSGGLYREHGIKEKLKTLSRAELVKILASDGMFVKRPVLLRNGRFACVGVREEEWKTLLAGDLR